MIHIHSFESMGTFDGPGIRLVVFMQGCNFKCLYCANPDTIAYDKGKLIEKDEIIRRALSEKAFFGKRGGVTFSGGEPLCQAKELLEVFKELKANGIHIVVDTNGTIMTDATKELLKYTDMVLLDVKAADLDKHKKITGAGNEQVLKTAKYLEEHNIPMRLRCVMIPGLNDSPEDIRLIGEMYSSFTNIDRVEVLPYHKYGVHKYESLGWKYELDDVVEHTPEQVEIVTDEFRKYFPTVWHQ